MKTYEYQKNYDLETSNWYFVGMKEVFMSLIERYKPQNITSLKIADVGCGTGMLLDCFKKYGDAIGVDVSPLAIKYCQKRGLTNVICEDATKLSFKENSFDLITAFNIIEHITDDELFIKEIKRTCRHGGRILIFTSAYNFLWNEHDVANEHKRRYSQKELREKVSQQGLRVIRIYYFNFLLFLPMLCWVLLEKIQRHFGIKKDHAAQRKLINPPGTINYFLTKILQLEGFLSQRINFPFGINLICVLEKT